MRGKEDDEIRTVDGVNWFPSPKSWVNQDIFIRWIQYEFPFVAPNSILLVFDSARSHISNLVKTFLHAKGILFAVIPGGLTGLLQPADVVWFKQLKADLTVSIDEWKSNDGHFFTRGGNVKPPTNADLSRWLSRAWHSISSETIVRCFQRCLLGDSLDLHIAQHELYGPLFRHKLVEIMDAAQSSTEVEVDEETESDIAEIYDE